MKDDKKPGPKENPAEDREAGAMRQMAADEPGKKEPELLSPTETGPAEESDLVESAVVDDETANTFFMISAAVLTAFSARWEKVPPLSEDEIQNICQPFSEYLASRFPVMPGTDSDSPLVRTGAAIAEAGIPRAMMILKSKMQAAAQADTDTEAEGADDSGGADSMKDGLESFDDDNATSH